MGRGLSGRRKDDEGRGRSGAGLDPRGTMGLGGAPKARERTRRGGEGGGARAQEERGGERRGLGGTLWGEHGV